MNAALLPQSALPSTDAAIEVVVKSTRFVSSGIRAIEMAREDGLALPAFRPGAHIDLHMAPQLVRQYSLCGSCEELGRYTIAVKLEPQSRGGSRAVHERLQEGSHLRISAPRNLFTLDEEAAAFVLVAGGIGITPLLCMARRLVSLRKPFRLHYFAHSEDQAAFTGILRGPGFAPYCHFHFGLDHRAIEATTFAALEPYVAGAQLYLCGPKAFMDAVCGVARHQGWPGDSIRLEYFSVGESLAASTDREISVRLARSGLTVPVAAGTPIIDALRAAGVEVDTSCEQGVCGTCLTRDLEGVPMHRDLFLTDAEKARGDCMAICVSRATTPGLVLDL